MVSDSSSSTILKTAFVHCKANNVSRNTASDFVNSIIAIALLVLLQKPDLNIIITSLFAHDTNIKSTFRCTKSKRSSWWLLPSHEKIFIFKWLLLNEKLGMHCYWVEDGSITGLLGWGFFIFQKESIQSFQNLSRITSLNFSLSGRIQLGNYPFSYLFLVSF